MEKMKMNFILLFLLYFGENCVYFLFLFEDKGSFIISLVEIVFWFSFVKSILMRFSKFSI